MPITSAGATAVILESLITNGMIGTGTPTVANAIGIGVSTWIQALPVTTIDTGAIGVGEGIAPLIVPTPLLLAAFFESFAGEGILGVSAPLFINGLSQGLTLTFIQGLILTTHPTVGTGAAICSFSPLSAIPFLIAAFSGNGLTNLGAIKMSTAIGIGLSTVFSSLILPSPIVGPAGPAPSAGSGFGNIV